MDSSLGTVLNSSFWWQVLAGEKDWTRSTEFRCKELTYTVIGLTEGADYYIRVIAVNDAGPGAPGVTEPVTVKEPQGMTALLLDQARATRQNFSLYI